MLHLALSARVEMPPVSRKANVGFGEARSKTATPASGLLETDNITGCQLSNLKVRSGSRPISPVQRKETHVSARFRVIQSDRFANSDLPPIVRCLQDKR